MSSPASSKSDPAWFQALFPAPLPRAEGDKAVIAGRNYVRKNGLVREQELVSSAQKQTEETFGFKWKRRDTFESPASLTRMREWLLERYSDVAKAPWLKDGAVVLDAGCGAGMSGLELFREALPRIHYVGADISEAADVAAQRFREAGVPGAFFQADLVKLPLKPHSLDAIFSEGVLHHTDSTFGAIKALAPLLKPGGHFCFYVYKKKGPIREFTDDYIRDKMQVVSPQEGWDLMMPLTKLGKVLGDLKLEIEVPDDITLLEIPKGKVDIQRLFYWHVFKAFHRPDFTLDEMNHINFDWYAPANAYRQTPEQVRAWCAEIGLEVEREVVEDAGITIVGRLRG
jgi:ubiquinone/menaquinone biosynthesis C-methylase UbiE